MSSTRYDIPHFDLLLLYGSENTYSFWPKTGIPIYVKNYYVLSDFESYLIQI